MSKILIIDDEPGILELLSEHLTMEGYEVETADSGEAGMQRMQAEQPDLVLLDVMLPGMDGYDVCQLMQADLTLSQIPVIMLTARTMTGDLVNAYETGADDFVTKPFDLDELLIRVRAQLHHLYHEQVSDLTGLPGSEAVEAELARRLESVGDWVVLYVDISNLRVYNEAYSFTDGDNLIRLAAESLHTATSECEDPDAFLGHVSGANFVVLVTKRALDCVRERAQSRFVDRALQYYSQSDREHDYLVALDHDGRPKHWSLPALTFDLVEHFRAGSSE